MPHALKRISPVSVPATASRDERDIAGAPHDSRASELVIPVGKPPHAFGVQPRKHSAATWTVSLARGHYDLLHGALGDAPPRRWAYDWSRSHDRSLAGNTSSISPAFRSSSFTTTFIHPALCSAFCSACDASTFAATFASLFASVFDALLRVRAHGRTSALGVYIACRNGDDEERAEEEEEGE